MLVPALLLLPLLCARPAERVELVFGGDIIPHGSVKRAAADHARRAEDGRTSLNHGGWDHVFEPIAGVLRGADLAVVNLETPVSGDAHAQTGPILFDAPPTLPQALAAAGVDVVSLANNHAFDQHPAGLQATWGQLEEVGLGWMGAGLSRDEAWGLRVVESHGVRLGLLSLTRRLNRVSNPVATRKGPQVAFVPYVPRPGAVSVDEAVERVRAAARRCDALIVSVHWGVEYSHTPKPEDRELAHALLEAGALAVIGHHPHVLQPIERYRTASGRDTLVAFSLGNLVANQDWQYSWRSHSRTGGRKRDSLLLRLSLTRPAPGTAVSLGDVEVLPVWIDNERPSATAAPPAPRQLQPVLIDEELRTLPERLQALPAPRRGEPRSLSQERLSLERRLELVRRRRQLIFQMALPSGPQALRAPSSLEASSGP